MRIIWIAFLCVFSVFVHSQQYNFINYTVQDGLAQSQVRDICQDSQGYLWVGTSGGLSRFNGTRFDNYSVDNGLPDNNIRRLYYGKSGRLWIATSKGVAYYIRGEFFPISSEDLYRTNDIEEFKGDAYFSTNFGIFQLKDQSLSLLKSSSTSDHNFRTIVNYKDSILLCGGKDGLFAWNGKEFSPFERERFGKTNIRDLEISENRLYAATRNQGAFCYHLTDKKLIDYDLMYRGVSLIDANESSIFGVFSDGGAFMLEEENVTYFSEDNGLYADNLTALYRDVEGNIWMGTDGKGLLKFSGKSVVSYLESDSLASDQVLSIVQDQKGKFTFGTYRHGITQIDFKKEEVKLIQSKDKDLIDNTIWSLSADQENNVWVGTSRGLFKLNQDGNIINEASNMFVNRKFRTILQLNDSTIVLGGNNGLTVISGDNIYSVHTAIDVNKFHLFEGKLFCASFDGLYVFDPTTNFSSYNRIDLPKESIVNTITSDDFGNLWIGTMNGLFVRDKYERMYQFPLDDLDYRSKSVVGLIKSKTNSIWVSTMNGVYCIKIDANSKEGYIIYNYGTSEGVVNKECNINALYEDSFGKIWIGTAKGLIRIDPSLDSVLFDYKKPNLHVTGIRLFMQDFNYLDYEVEMDSIFEVPTTLELPYNKNHLTFDFIGINLKDPQAVRYEHRMIGATERWSPISSTNMATYSFLPSGEYYFQVRASNKNNDWSLVKEVHVIIYPPFWRTWWFIGLCIISSFLIVYLAFRSRIRALKQRQDNEKLNMKNRLLFLEQQSLNASMNRHFIFNSLNSIQYFINSSDKLSANRFLSNFAKLIRKNLDSSASTNFIVTLQEEIDRIRLYLTLEKMRFSDKFDYKLTMDPALDSESIEIPSMILQPFVENSIIHGVLSRNEGGLISINIYEDLGEVVFVVEDNGIGIDVSLASKKEYLEGDHESKGVEITNRRIELLRKLTGEDLLITGPFQMNGEKSEVLGTKVIIKLGGTHKFK